MRFISYYFKAFSPVVLKFLVIIGLSVSVFSCQWGDEVTTLVPPNPDDFSASFSDTTSVKVSIVATDSFMTGSQTRLFVGKFTDPYFGIMQATTFFQPGLQSSLVLAEKSEYDSLILSLEYDGYYYGDTTKIMDLSVHALQEDILLKNAYYSDDTTPYDPTPIGRALFHPNPRPNIGNRVVTKKILKIKLSSALGKKIFDAAKANLLTTNAEWINLLKGITLVPAANNSAVVGFLTASASLQMHFHTPQIEGVTKDSTVFPLAALYNQILSDKSKTVLSKLPSRRFSLPSSQTGELGMIQAGSGVMTRVDLPTVKQLSNNKYTFANRAYLIIEPLLLSATDKFRAPQELHVYLCDKNNEYLLGNDGFPVPLSNLDGAPVAGNLVNDLINNKQYYKLDVSQYVSTILRSDSDEAAGLLLRTSGFDARKRDYRLPDIDSDFSKSFDRLVFGSYNNSTSRGIKLQLYYTTIKVE